MALDFGLLNSVFDTSAGDINLKLKGLREELAVNFIPDLADGELVLWLPLGDVYDVYNSVVDLTKWTYSNTNNTTNSETATYIIMDGIAPAGQGIIGLLEADNLPALSTFSNLKFRITVDLDESANNNTGNMYFGIFGESATTVTYTVAGGVVDSWDDEYELRKKSNNDWDIYKNDVYYATITPADSNLRFALGGNAGAGAHTGDVKIFDITIDGSAFLLAAANGKTYRTPMQAI